MAQQLVGLRRGGRRLVQSWERALCQQQHQLFSRHRQSYSSQGLLLPGKNNHAQRSSSTTTSSGSSSNSSSRSSSSNSSSTISSSTSSSTGSRSRTIHHRLSACSSGAEAALGQQDDEEHRQGQGRVHRRHAAPLHAQKRWLRTSSPWLEKEPKQGGSSKWTLLRPQKNELEALQQDSQSKQGIKELNEEYKLYLRAVKEPKKTQKEIQKGRELIPQEPTTAGKIKAVMFKVPGMTYRGAAVVVSFMWAVIKNPMLLREKWGDLVKGIKDMLHHYKIGSKLLWNDIKTAKKIIARLLTGHALSRRERKQLLRTAADIFRMVPLAAFFLVPFLELLLPLALKVFPNMLPSTFQDLLKKEEDMKKQLRMRLAMAGFLQETLEEMARAKHNRVKKTEEEGGEQDAEDQSSSAKELMSFIEKAKMGNMENEAITRFARLFKDELMLDNLPRAQLVNLCRFMALQPFGSDNFLRFQLRSHMRMITQDDQRILWEGLETLTKHELSEACRERGMRATGMTKMGYKRQLANWLDLSINQSVPISLLIMSRAFTLEVSDPTAALAESMSSMDEDVVTEVLIDAASGEERDSAEHRELKLESLERQNELIEEERERRDNAIRRKLAAEEEEKRAKKQEKEEEETKAREAREAAEKELADAVLALSLAEQAAKKAARGEDTGEEQAGAEPVVEEAAKKKKKKKEEEEERETEKEEEVWTDQTGIAAVGLEEEGSVSKETQREEALQLRDRLLQERETELERLRLLLKQQRQQQDTERAEADEILREKEAFLAGMADGQDIKREVRLSAEAVKTLETAFASLTSDSFVEEEKHQLATMKTALQALRQSSAEGKKKARKEVEEGDAEKEGAAEGEMKKGDGEVKTAKTKKRESEGEGKMVTAKLDDMESLAEAAKEKLLEDSAKVDEAEMSEAERRVFQTEEERQEEKLKEAKEEEDKEEDKEAREGLSEREAEVIDAMEKEEKEREKAAMAAKEAATAKGKTVEKEMAVDKKKVEEREEAEEGEEEEEDEGEDEEQQQPVDKGVLRMQTKLASMLEKLEKDIAVVEKEVGQKHLLLDSDRDGIVSAEELEYVIKGVLGGPLADEEARKIVAQLDGDKDGQISLQELLDWAARYEEQLPDELFDHLDKNQQSLLRVREQKLKAKKKEMEEEQQQQQQQQQQQEEEEEEGRQEPR